MVGYGAGAGLDAFAPVTARVYSRSNSSWYSTIEINKGSSDGVEDNQPVINGAGLVGKVKTVSDGNAVVMLLSDADFGVSGLAVAGRPARLDPARRRLAGRPALRPRARRQGGPQGRQRRHRGHRLGPAALAVPAGHPDRHRQARRRRSASSTGRSTSTPAADLRNLDFVQVLTEPAADLRASTTATP